MDNKPEPNNNYFPGLEGVIAAETFMSSVDGQRGELIIAGFPVQTLAGNASFEEVIYLLWHGRLPSPTELAALRAALAARRVLPDPTLALLREAARRDVKPMDALRMAAATLDLQIAGDMAKAMAARFPTIVAAYWRLLNGQEPLAPDGDLGHAANYLYMLSGQRPTEVQTRALETYLNTVSDHGLNASTFTARTIISTGSDLVSAVVGAIGALKGPAHGGAPGPALDMVFEIGDVQNAQPFLQAKLDGGERLMGFGHRVYKVRDPRAELLSAAAEKLYTSGNAIQGDIELYNHAREVERVAVALLNEYKPGRNLQTNVEYYTALLLHGLGLPNDLFTPTFAIGRVAGWIGHCLEQQRSGRLIRPGSRYVGRRADAWIPLEDREPQPQPL
jgi:citrate synthase